VMSGLPVLRRGWWASRSAVARSEVAGVRTEAVGRDVVFDAIMAAAGLAGEEGSAGHSSLSSRTDRAAEASSRPAEPASTCCTPAEPRITLVTGPGCG